MRHTFQSMFHRGRKEKISQAGRSSLHKKKKRIKCDRRPGNNDNDHIATTNNNAKMMQSLSRWGTVVCESSNERHTGPAVLHVSWWRCSTCACTLSRSGALNACAAKAIKVDGCVPLFEQRLAALALANAQLSFFSFFLHNEDKRGINQIDKVAGTFVRARFERRSAGTHRSDCCDGQMEDAAAEGNLVIVRLEKQWKEESSFFCSRDQHRTKTVACTITLAFRLPPDL